jgi:phage N-6-adenine-methyltransferase
VSEIASLDSVGALDNLAAEINAEHRACEAALKSGLGHALKAGDLLMEAKSRTGHGEWGRWLAKNFEGSERTAQAYMKVARELPGLEGEDPQRVADLSFRGALKELGGSSVHFSSGTAEWRTPYEIIRRVVETLGRIDLDPCAEEGKGVPAAEHFTKEDDGLSRAWAGRVFMNPPYCREIGPWVEKLLEECAAGRVSEALALVPARTDTEWFYALRGYPRCFVKGRLRFSEYVNSAPFPSALVYLGPRRDAFAANFADLGDVVESVSAIAQPPLDRGSPITRKLVKEASHRAKGQERGGRRGAAREIYLSEARQARPI